MYVILLILFSTAIFPANGSIISIIWEIIFGKGGRIPRVRNIETARSLNSYAVLDFIGLVERHGFPGEEHNLTTSDGYNLKIHRIPGSPTNKKSKGKPVVFMQHGLLASSDSYVLMGPENDLAYLLADVGYDVWLGNQRGNTYSRSHQTLSPDRDNEFWKFSFHEIALYDVADSIDYILEETGQKSLIYIGHSMGTTISLVLLSTKPEFNDKIRFNVLLSPIAFFNHKLTPTLQLLINQGPLIKSILERNQLNELLPLTETSVRTLKAICSEFSILQPLCVLFFFEASGHDPDQLNTKALPHVLSYFPAGTSSRSILHFYHNIVSGKFQLYDYGEEENFMIYGQEKPPSYKLQNIKTPSALLYGGGDILSGRPDCEKLRDHLSNVLTLERVPYQKFSHLDFLWAKDIKSLLNNRIIQLMSTFFNETENVHNSISYR